MALTRELTVKCIQFYMGMLKAEKNLRVVLKELNKLRKDCASMEMSQNYKDEVATLTSKVEQLKADLFSKSKELLSKEDALVKVRE